ncbi:haloalkane dehalogenase [Deinococcus aerophilus]|uniref:Haloalkane dehalogenase n=1 Tax=Deinococcus aerophilus TaxID=522488 RepID=A0ABQ2GZ22_9DEIO|nr:haloalkane dehalogenase [Deinococcus aerophilus]GGM20869.1 haloalkane dehalogenase 3 [Deinococcus aerophilus]
MTRSSTPSPADPYARRRLAVLDTELAFVDVGSGDPIVFLHGNPTSSYLWRNVIPEVEALGRCLAPDLVGMGASGQAPAGRYRIADHARYLDAWFDALGLQRVTLVLHDWGGALGFHWAARHPERVARIAYMETIVQPVTWEDWDPGAVRIFQGMRGEAGEALILQKNIFIERILPSSILRPLSDEEMEAYRRPFPEAGEDRRPMLTFPRELPIEGEPEDVVAMVEAYGRFLQEAPVPKLFINADPGSILIGRQREFCRSWPNQQEVTVGGRHFLQEDSPVEIGRAVAQFIRDTPLTR